MKPRILETSFLEDVCHEIYGDSFIHYEIIEKELGKLKTTGVLGYKDLDFISEEWKLFYEWYHWPTIEQFNEKLEQVTIDFTQLNNYRTSNHYWDEEKNIFDKLYFLFNHIELVSIIFRFVNPEKYGIYSPPVAYYIQSPRGINYQDEYFNYLTELNKYKRMFALDKTSDTEMFFWLLAKMSYYKIQRDDQLEINGYDMKVKTAQENDRIGQVLPEIFRGKSLLGVAETLYSFDLHDQAAKFAGMAFEQTVTELCDQMGLYKRYSKQNNKKEYPTLDEKIQLLKSNGVFIPCASYVKDLRNDAIHKFYRSFHPEEVKSMIDTTKDVERKMQAT